MSMLKLLSIEDIRRRGTIRDGDVELLRAAYAAGETLSAADADLLFDLHAACPIKAAGWSAFFVDALTDYVVHQASPAGYVVAEKARWLTSRIGAFGRVETSTELTLLVHVIETARWTPPSLAAFGLAQVRDAVATGTGPLRAGQTPAPGTITPDEVELAARIVRAFGGDTTIAVTRAEAEGLIAINRAIAAGHSSPAWSTLFIRCVGSALLAALGHAIPSRRELTQPLAMGGAGEVIDLFSGAGTGARRLGSPDIAGGASPMLVWGSARLLTPEQRALARLERQRLEIVTNEVIEETTDVWLMARLGEAAGLAENELSLLRFVTREASQLSSALGEFAARALIAA